MNNVKELSSRVKTLYKHSAENLLEIGFLLTGTLIAKSSFDIKNFKIKLSI
jgi:hypothetical protein